ncbi:MAG: hypothetical protein H0U18_15265 [Pyrinomonadaceae bacterium]|nr:hypothetical protein [Pyrinomonadaceae bacterium]
MSEPESNLPKTRQSLNEELARIFEGITEVAQKEDQVKEPDPLALLGEEDLSKESIKAQVAQLREDVKQTKRINLFRLGMLVALFAVIILWIVSVMAITAILGFHLWGFTLSDAVMMTYITTTTASVFGLFLIAAKWLYPSTDKN